MNEIERKIAGKNPTVNSLWLLFVFQPRRMQNATCRLDEECARGFTCFKPQSNPQGKCAVSFNFIYLVYLGLI